MKRISAVVLSSVIALTTLTTESKAVDASSIFLGTAAFLFGSYMGKKWEREDPRRNRMIVQPVNNNNHQPVTEEYVNGPTGRYYYQPTTYAYEPQRVVIRDAY
jgi:hypothetical protein